MYQQPDRAVLPAQNQGPPPPIGGYYAPEVRIRPDRQFVGGRHLSEQQIAEAKHRFESQSGFVGPYHGSGSHRTPDSRFQDAAYGTPAAVPPSVSSTVQHPQHRAYDQGAPQPYSSPYQPSHHGEAEQPGTVRSLDRAGQHLPPDVSGLDLPSQRSYSGLRDPSPQPPSRTAHPTQAPSTETHPTPNAARRSRHSTHNFSHHHRQGDPAPNTDAFLPPHHHHPPPAADSDDVPPPPPPKDYPPSAAARGSSRAVSQAATRASGSSYPVPQQRTSASTNGADPRRPGAQKDAAPTHHRRRKDEDDEIVMSSTAYPGQEWQPTVYGHWDED